MKKLFIILLIFISVAAYAKMGVIERNYYDNQKIKIIILCIDGYKYILVYGDYSERTSSMIQMYEWNKIFSKVMPVSCK